MLTEHLQHADNRAAGLPGSNQGAFAEMPEKFLDTMCKRHPALRPKLDAIVEDSLRDNAAMLGYLTDH